MVLLNIQNFLPPGLKFIAVYIIYFLSTYITPILLLIIKFLIVVIFYLSTIIILLWYFSCDIYERSEKKTI